MITIKIYNIYHDVCDDMSISELENRMEYAWHDIESVRIAKGHTNSPIFVTLDTNIKSLRTIKTRCRSIVRIFSEDVPGVDVDKTINDANIRITDT